MSVKITKVKNDQKNELRNIIEVTFLETFAHLNTAEDIEIYSAKAFTTEQIVKEFHNENSFFFFVYFEEAIAGYLKLNIEKAIEFYKRQGLSEFSTHDFMLGNDPQTDILMQLKL